MSQENVEIVRRIYDAFNRGNPEALALSYIDPGVSLAPIGCGEWRGRTTAIEDLTTPEDRRTHVETVRQLPRITTTWDSCVPTSDDGGSTGGVPVQLRGAGGAGRASTRVRPTAAMVTLRKPPAERDRKRLWRWKRGPILSRRTVESRRETGRAMSRGVRGICVSGVEAYLRREAIRIFFPRAIEALNRRDLEVFSVFIHPEIESVNTPQVVAWRLGGVPRPRHLALEGQRRWLADWMDLRSGCSPRPRQ